MHHNYPFDPRYGYSLKDLLAVTAPPVPDDFESFWRRRYWHTMAFRSEYKLTACGSHAGYQINDISYTSTGGFTINGWLLIPEHQKITQGIVIGHGYGGRQQPDYHLPMPGAVLFFPCFRGISRSRCASVAERPDQHVLHGIDNPHDYILGGCVEDLWVAVSVLLLLYPHIEGRIGYMGISFGGGIGALALPWDRRIARAHFNVPTFGNQPLRLKLPTVGSAAAVKQYSEQHHHAFATLSYYDAAIAAGFARKPAYFALGLFDPVVAPPGQFSIYNAWAGEKTLFILDAGHFDYPNSAAQEQQLITALIDFFGEHSY